MTNDPFEAVHIYQILLLFVFFSDTDESPIFFVPQRASRRYSGITPGSMPAKSSKIQQEGVLFKLMVLWRIILLKRKK